ncbi:uncharacterized protein LOC126807754 [Patella vulgata]|uniref:uncharacterized protein LOC126807754 n=1 Tax=Patella vulgata TaxID=6465 RepID=UPI0021801D33|nr:uncharacterized protein LOC126807754 [Patella vulgata]XP_050388487.1 uncharacterized protein LOC126807754 [Patella vulgata]XP_050388488.1 uncharacterized protein LOC126807754 [Patella vulgata]XP_050388490.1 uncharacterized protein LOC126807754 [Patella vulgata]XP_050388491.1 uncharacterized protein LOC126807754 [Patella vulgata]
MNKVFTTILQCGKNKLCQCLCGRLPKICDNKIVSLGRRGVITWNLSNQSNNIKTYQHRHILRNNRNLCQTHKSYSKQEGSRNNTIEDRLKDKNRPSVTGNAKDEIFTEEFKVKSSEIITEEIEDVEDFTDTEDTEQIERILPISLNRGKEGVFDLDDFVTLLKESNVKDLCVLKIPENIQFINYMVIVSALSYRHMLAISNNINYVYKKRKNRKDRFLNIEGINTRNWFAIDMGNILLHIFMPETRDVYDLETLWTVGTQFDSKVETQNELDLIMSRLGLDMSLYSPDDTNLKNSEMGLDNRPK